MCVEVTVCNTSVVFETQCILNFRLDFYLTSGKLEQTFHVAQDRVLSFTLFSSYSYTVRIFIGGNIS